MKFTSSQVLSMSWKEWNETMAEELNKAGFKGVGYNHEKHRLERGFAPYYASDDLSSFILGTVGREQEITYLKSIGLLNNDRCPLCGGSINNKPATYTDGYNEKMTFHICQSCCSHGQRTSVNPANNPGCGCMVGLLLIPYHLVKTIFFTLFTW